MSNFNSIEVLASLTEAREAVLVRKAGCRSDVAREAHRKVAHVLYVLVDGIELEREALGGFEDTLDADEGEGDDWLYSETVDPSDEVWFKETAQLLEGLDSQPDGGHGFPDRIPEMMPVPAGELDGLAELLAGVQVQTGIDLRVIQAQTADGRDRVHVIWPADFLA